MNLTFFSFGIDTLVSDIPSAFGGGGVGEVVCGGAASGGGEACVGMDGSISCPEGGSILCGVGSGSAMMARPGGYSSIAGLYGCPGKSAS